MAIATVSPLSIEIRDGSISSGSPVRSILGEADSPLAKSSAYGETSPKGERQKAGSPAGREDLGRFYLNFFDPFKMFNIAGEQDRFIFAGSGSDKRVYNEVSHESVYSPAKAAFPFPAEFILKNSSFGEIFTEDTSAFPDEINYGRSAGFLKREWRSYLPLYIFDLFLKGLQYSHTYIVHTSSPLLAPLSNILYSYPEVKIYHLSSSSPSAGSPANNQSGKVNAETVSSPLEIKPMNLGKVSRSISRKIIMLYALIALQQEEGDISQAFKKLGIREKTFKKIEAPEYKVKKGLSQEGISVLANHLLNTIKNELQGLRLTKAQVISLARLVLEGISFAIREDEAWEINFGVLLPQKIAWRSKEREARRQVGVLLIKTVWRQSGKDVKETARLLGLRINQTAKKLRELEGFTFKIDKQQRKEEKIWREKVEEEKKLNIPLWQMMEREIGLLLGDFDRKKINQEFIRLEREGKTFPEIKDNIVLTATTILEKKLREKFKEEFNLSNNQWTIQKVLAAAQKDIGDKVDYFWNEADEFKREGREIKEE